MLWLTSSNPVREIWRRIGEFGNEEKALARIAALHGEPTKKTLGNYRKQARQVRVALLQAREYFAAAEAASLYTRPNLLYYGSVALTMATMLMHGTGDRSLDVLRASNKNKHHGLDFVTRITGESCAKGLAMLNDTSVIVLQNGHFQNWYSAQPESAPMYGIHRIETAGAQLTRAGRVGELGFCAIDTLCGRRFNLAALLSTMPEFFAERLEIDRSIACTRVSCQLNSGSSGQSILEFRLHGAGSEQNLDRILEGFSVRADLVDKLEVSIHGAGAIVKFRRDSPSDTLHFPSTRMSSEHELYMYADAVDRPEMADAFMVLFALSMLCRYYPDLWVAAVDAKPTAISMVEKFINVYEEKMPLLALTGLVGDAIVVASTRAPWILT